MKAMLQFAAACTMVFFGAVSASGCDESDAAGAASDGGAAAETSSIDGGVAATPSGSSADMDGGPLAAEGLGLACAPGLACGWFDVCSVNTPQCNLSCRCSGGVYVCSDTSQCPRVRGIGQPCTGNNTASGPAGPSCTFSCGCGQGGVADVYGCQDNCTLAPAASCPAEPPGPDSGMCTLPAGKVCRYTKQTDRYGICSCSGSGWTCVIR